MNIKRLGAQSVQYTAALGFLCLCGLLLALPANAQILNEPQYSKTEVKKKWQKMIPSSFEGTVLDLVRQCRAQAGIDEADALTLQKCVQLEEHVRADLCDVIYVPDGEEIVFDFLQGRQGGESVTLEAVQKELGRLDRALWCDLGSVHTYWFTGDSGQSCNNLAVVFITPILRATKQVLVCRKVSTGTKVEPGSFQYLDGFVLRSCDDEDNFYVPGHLSHSENKSVSFGTREICKLITQ